MSDLIKRLRERATSYRLGGPSSEHTAVMLDDAAHRIEALEADLKSALREVSRYAAEAGEAKGRLEMSEAAGIVDGWREKCERLEAENAALREQVAWRPIESAPKDGTQVLCYGVGRNDEPYMGVTSWLRGWPGSLWPIAYMAYADCINPTHWRPLPAPPATDGEG